MVAVCWVGWRRRTCPSCASRTTLTRYARRSTTRCIRAVPRQNKQRAEVAMMFDARTFGTTLVEAMPDAVIYADAEGMIRSWNGGATRIFGFAAEEAMGA